MSTIIDTSTQLIGQIAKRLDTNNVQHRQYLNNLSFAQQIQAQGQPQLQLQPAANTTNTVVAPAVETPVATGSDNAPTAGTNASANELNRLLQEWISALRA